MFSDILDIGVLWSDKYISFTGVFKKGLVVIHCLEYLKYILKENYLLISVIE